MGITNAAFVIPNTVRNLAPEKENANFANVVPAGEHKVRPLRGISFGSLIPFRPVA